MLGKVLGKRAAKTHKGKKILKNRAAKVVEDAKTALLLRGNKGGHEVQMLLRDLFSLRNPLALLYMRKHAEHPFEDASHLEKLCNKFGHTLFALGSSSKKRPFRLVLGRLFDEKILDMQEFGIEDYKSISSFGHTKSEVVIGSKPMVLFQGTAFDTDERMKRAKSLLLDFFRGPTPEQVMLSGLSQVIVCSTFDTGSGSSTGSSEALQAVAKPSLSVRRYRVQMLKSGSRLPRVELEELGPSFTMVLDRTKEPEKERWKMSIRVPKAAKPKKVKNVASDTLGKKQGKIHLGKQNFDQIHTVHHGLAKKRKLKKDLDKNSADA